MPQIMDARLGRDVGLTVLSQDVAVRSLLPLALSGLTADEADVVRRDLEKMKLLRLEPSDPGSAWHHLRSSRSRYGRGWSYAGTCANAPAGGGPASRASPTRSSTCCPKSA
ncbi:hypothetical protein [Streptomyces chrestomyceticus]|uniref:hypothetical protein n=1 Tax=Streptomyces chrestomyceticus TaxID=68185 RepID=UPI0034094447